MIEFRTGRAATPTFVFGSNLAGRHGKGAALHAVRYWGAEYGNGEGFQGNSYAIPTKDANLVTLPLEQIDVHVERFVIYAKHHPHRLFLVTPIGCGLAGYKRTQIMPLFQKTDLPLNVVFTKDWVTI